MARNLTLRASVALALAATVVAAATGSATWAAFAFIFFLAAVRAGY